MRTPSQQAAFDAVKRLDPHLVMAGQLTVLQCAVRALIFTSPNPTPTRAYFDQLFGQLQAYPGVDASEDFSIVLRDLVETIFLPPASPET